MSPEQSGSGWTGRAPLAAALVFLVGVAVRLSPRYLTPLPFNPDGFNFARRAEQTVATGNLAVDSAPHGVLYPTLLAQLRQVTGASALSLTQPTIAVVGTVPCLFAFAFARRIGRARGWSVGRSLAGATLAGLVLATEGLYLRRTATVSYEVLGILLVVVSAYALHRLLERGRLRWAWVLVLSLLVLPVTHHLSSMMAALTLTALAVIHLRRSPTARTALVTAPVVGVFWLYFSVYYLVTEPPFFEDVATKPGLFLAWLVVLPVLVGVFGSTGSRRPRLAFAVPFAGGFGLVGLNATTDLFPGTASTHPRLLLYLAPLVVPVALAGWGLPVVVKNHDVGPVVLAALLGPPAFVGFALTAGLTPEYTLFARRTQTFLHLSVMVTAAVAVASLGWRGGSVTATLRTVGLPAVLLACALASLPLAFAGPPVLPYEPVTTSEQFETVGFTDEHTAGTWTSDDHLVRVARNYYEANASVQPTYQWLQGGTPPGCPVVVRGSWPADGAQAYPNDPIPVDRGDLDAVGQLVYTTGGQRVVLPNGQTRPC